MPWLENHPLNNKTTLEVIRDLSPQALLRLFEDTLDEEPHLAIQMLHLTGEDPKLYEMKLMPPMSDDQQQRQFTTPQKQEENWSVGKLRNLLTDEDQTTPDERLIIFRTFTKLYAGRETDRGKEMVSTALFDTGICKRAIQECPEFFRSCIQAGISPLGIFASVGTLAGIDEPPWNDATWVEDLVRKMVALGDIPNGEALIDAAITPCPGTRAGFVAALGAEAFAQARDNQNGNALHRIARVGSLKRCASVADLLELGIDPLHRNALQQSPLDNAIANTSALRVQQLIDTNVYDSKTLRQAREKLLDPESEAGLQHSIREFRHKIATELAAYIDATLAKRMTESSGLTELRPLA